MSRLYRTGSLLAAIVLACTAGTATAQSKNIGEVTAVIPEASTADDASETVDGQSGDTAYPFIGTLKALATVGEVDASTGKALTGYPDGQAAWLADENTVRVVYQSESYGTMSTQTYAWEMASGATFTGSHIHAIDYDRAGLSQFLNNSSAASTIVEGSNHLFDTVYNVFGDEVVPRASGGAWGNAATPDGSAIDYAPNMTLTEGEFFFQSFCGSWYEKPDRYGPGIGFADHVWLTAEEWNIQSMYTDGDGNPTFDTNETMGLASLVVDIANRTAYTVPALGQTGYEKFVPINPQHPDYVVIVAAGYNHDVEPAPLKVYIGRKGYGANGQPLPAGASQRDQFLARNGLLYGKLYGMAVANSAYATLGIDTIDTSEKMMDAYMFDPSAPDNFDVAFVPTSYQWSGWDSGVAVGQTEMLLWQAAGEQPAGHTYFVGDSKTEHAAPDPEGRRSRWVQNLTNPGGIVAVELPNLRAELAAAGGDLPALVSGAVTRTVPAWDGSLTLEVGGKGIKHAGAGTHATWEDGQAKTVANDGLAWIKTSDVDILIIDEDSGNDYGERKFAIAIDPSTMMPTEPGRGYFLALAGGSENPRATAGVSAYGGAFSRATSSEFSGTWPLTAMLTRKTDGSFYTMAELAGKGEQDVMSRMPLRDHLFFGVVQHRGESGGPVAAAKADNGGQIFMFNMDLPRNAMTAVVELGGATPSAFSVDPAKPNPFNPSTSIRYRLAEGADVSVKVFNTAGQHIATIADGFQPAGNYAATWNGRDAAGQPVATGVYLFTVRAGELVHQGRMTLLK